VSKLLAGALEVHPKNQGEAGEGGAVNEAGDFNELVSSTLPVSSATETTPTVL
jgi:hypothetical protein